MISRYSFQFKLVLCHAVISVFVAIAAFAEAPTLPPAAKKTVEFAKDIHAILAEHCYECHGQGKSKSGFSMDKRDGFIQGGESGPAVVVGKSEESHLIKLVSGLEPDKVMPPKSPRLSDDEIGLLRAWIDQGLVWYAKGEEQSQGWVASVAPRRPELPAAKEGVKSDNPIDRFLAVYFEQHKVTPGALVSDSALQRRVYLDVWGLLPEQKALDAYAADQAPDKYSKLVDSLLDDRQAYAENWMTYWNDQLRNDFKGTGYIDGGRKSITDFLYNALYENLPYDQFASHLINPTSESEGFANGIVWRGVTAAAMLPPIQAAQTVSQVFLGVNLKCASCHDSFIDHWKLADSYGMAGCFTDEALELVRCDIPQGKTAPAKFLWPEVGTIDAKRSKAGRRTQLARLVTSEQNGFFTRTIVNRLWAKFMGRGIIEPLESIEREPWNPDLLDWLATDLVDNGYDLKHTMRLILTSQAYRMTTVSTDPQALTAYVFRGPEVRRMGAEEFLDALSCVTGAWQANPQFDVPKPEKERKDIVRAWRIDADALTRAMGRPNREQVVLRRPTIATALEAVELTNGGTLTGYLQRSASTLLTTPPQEPGALVNEVYMRAVQRKPTEKEAKVAIDLLGKTPTPETVADLLWAIAMLPEFQLIG